MSIFTPNKEELELAKNNGRVVIPWTNGEKARLMITEYKEKDNLDIFVCTVKGGDHDGKEQALFFRTNNEYDKASAIRLLLEFFEQDKLIAGECSPVDIIGKIVETTASVKPKDTGEGNWTNFNYFKAVSDVPNMDGGTLTSDDIPF